jgi:hypothetical protein
MRSFYSLLKSGNIWQQRAFFQQSLNSGCRHWKAAIGSRIGRLGIRHRTQSPVAKNVSYSYGIMPTQIAG